MSQHCVDPSGLSRAVAGSNAHATVTGDRPATDVPESNGDTCSTRHRQPLIILIGTLLAVFVGLSWALASPPMTSPDDDYHLGSIWCPRPADEHCATTQDGDQLLVEVPAPLMPTAMWCFLKQPEKSARCAQMISDAQSGWSARFDAGNYPVGYYHFHHLFAGKNIDLSVVLMRSVNAILAVGLIALIIGLITQRRVSRALTVAIVASWFPMGLYFIASNNPTSWALTGVFAYAVAMYAAAQEHGRRRWGLLACAVIAAIMCLACRYDASFYLFVVGVALLFAVRWRWQRWPEALIAIVAAVVGVHAMFSTSNAQALPTQSAGASGFSLSRLLDGILCFPKYLGGFFGYYWAPGWAGDASLEHRAPFVLSILALGALLMVGLRFSSWRRWLTITVMLGAMVGLPAVFFAAGVFDQLLGYQARYSMPLLAVLLFFFFAVDVDDAPLLSRPQTVAVVLAAGVAHSFALHAVLLRYTLAMEPGELLRFPRSDNTWWWYIPLTPMMMWLIASFAGFVLITLMLRSSRCALTQPTADAGPRSAEQVVHAD